ncbi:SsgA family sporulation/cell division regulator [Streptomyces sp. NPDC001255]|uniref:SsgA family sporulation/cell division regulator n=1 Tax=Streptomyces sp. NPDC001255 TaxID=3364550 RepID=UPI0036CB15D0
MTERRGGAASYGTAGAGEEGTSVCETVFRQIRASGVQVPVAARLSYDTRRPYEVALDLRPARDRGVRWVLSRDLLLAGTRSRSGLGDVRVAPVPGPGRDGAVVVRLGPPGASASFATDRHVLRRWLAYTGELVPLGTEAARIDWDEVAARLLR